MSRRFLQGASGWSPIWQISASGRWFARNKEDTGTIMKWDNSGNIQYTVIFDAQYRLCGKFYSSKTELLDIPVFSVVDKYMFGVQPTNAASYTDDKLNLIEALYQDTRTNTDATNSIMSSSAGSSTSYIAPTVRSLASLNPTGCDVPTISCLARIYGDAVLLDSMDPTATEYSNYKLTSWSFPGSTESGVIWSSTYNGRYSATNHLFLAIRNNNNGYIGRYTQNVDYGVIPVLDISNPG